MVVRNFDPRLARTASAAIARAATTRNRKIRSMQHRKRCPASSRHAHATGTRSPQSLVRAAAGAAGVPRRGLRDSNPPVTRQGRSYAGAARLRLTACSRLPAASLARPEAPLEDAWAAQPIGHPQSPGKGFLHEPSGEAVILVVRAAAQLDVVRRGCLLPQRRKVMELEERGSRQRPVPSATRKPSLIAQTNRRLKPRYVPSHAAHAGSGRGEPRGQPRDETSSASRQSRRGRADSRTVRSYAPTTGRRRL